MMRAALFFIALSITSSFATISLANPHAGMGAGAPAAAGGNALTGKVAETMNSAGYTYILLDQGKDKKKWVAIPVTEVKVGQEVTIAPGMEMGQFTSKSLNRTFDEIVFSSGLLGGASNAAPKAADPHKAPAPAVMEPIKVDKATGKIWSVVLLS